MRLKATIKNHDPLTRAIIYNESESSFYLLVFSDDHRYGFDDWSLDLETVKHIAEAHYGIAEGEWEEIPDALPGTLPQFEQPTVGFRDQSGILQFLSYDEALQRGIVPAREVAVEVVENPQLLKEVRSLLSRGKTLEAMQLYLRHTHCTLITAKQVIEQLKKTV